MTDSITGAAPAAGAGTSAGEPGAPAGVPCVNDPANPACARRMIAVGRLTAHPGNVRAELDLTAEFCASVAENGVRVPLLITTGGDGGFRVIEGHRRLMAAVKAGLEQVPYDLDSDRAADEAGQYLDMVTANSAAYRKNFTALEEATALFAAHEAGATRTRIRKATGRKPDQVKTALAAGGISAGTREQAAGLDRQLTLDELALFAEFESDPDAMEHLTRAITYRYPLEHAAERIRQDKAEAAEHERIRAELEAAGCPVTGEIVAGSSLLTSLAHDGVDLTPDNHRDCPGHGGVFPQPRPADPGVLLHRPGRPWPRVPLGAAGPVSPPASAGGADPDEASAMPGGDGAGAEGTYGPVPGPVPEPVVDPAVEAARQLVADGNKAWAAAWEVRKRWVAQLLARRTAPKQVTRFVAQQLLTMPDALRRGLPAAAGRLVFTELTGKAMDAVLRDTETCPEARVPLLALAPIAIAYEGEMAGEGERRNTWRTGAWAPCSRADAGGWLTFLAGLGYQLAGIEQAVADDVPWAGDGTPGEPDTGSPATPGEPGDSTDPAGPGPDDHDAAADTDAGAGLAAEPGSYPGQAVA